MDTAEIKKRIVQGGMKFTHQRMVIYGALSLSEDHPTAERVHEKIKSANPSISLGTVYKTLDSFVNAGILQKFTDDTGIMRFDPVLETHSHLYCNDSKEFRDFKNPLLEKLLKSFFEENEIEGFEVEEVSLVIKGKTK
ncbi:Fur family transcriptional regulator [Negadavirga shengliensis]|uniref:Fur family transcriptional regulator n=1 Tax=Negadavirga shengliensis TaxID=1389218 RepID=A0ABV9T5X7_9BACT